MNTKQAKSIVPPEPHSTGINKAWSLMPRWLQVVLLVAFVIGGILVVIFMR